MELEQFELERIQSLHENEVTFNLTESGIHPLTIREFLDPEEIGVLADLRLGYGYTNGTPEARAAIARLYPGASAENVLVTNGSAEANFVSILSFLSAGDELIVMQPNYQQIWGLARSLGMRVIPFPLDPARGWRPDLAALRRQANARTRMIAVCNPDNPTGAVLTPEEMAEIAKIAVGCGAWLHADEVYRGAEMEGPETPSFYGRGERVLVAGGLSKAYALPGLRFGWLAGPADAIARAWAARDYTTIAAGSLSNHLAVLALIPGRRERILERNRAYLRRNLAIISEWVAGHGDLFTFTPPRAGGFAWLRHRLPLSSREFCEQLRLQKSVFVIAGECFGMEGYLRIGLGSESDYLRQGLRLIDEFIAAQGWAAPVSGDRA